VTYNNRCWIELLDLLHLIHSQLRTTGNSAITDLHTLQFTVTNALAFSVFSSRILATDFLKVSLSLQITHKVSFSQPNSFLAIILQLPKTPLNSKTKVWTNNPLLYTSIHSRYSTRTSAKCQWQETELSSGIRYAMLVWGSWLSVIKWNWKGAAWSEFP
jgi:hypothetical protein